MTHMAAPFHKAGQSEQSGLFGRAALKKQELKWTQRLRLSSIKGKYKIKEFESSKKNIELEMSKIGPL